MRRKRHQVYIELNANYFQTLRTVPVELNLKNRSLCMNWFRKGLKLSPFPHFLPPDDTLNTTKCGDSVTKRDADTENPEISAETAW